MAQSSSQHLVTAGLLIVALVVGVFVWQPLRGKVQDLQTSLATADAELVSVQTEVARLQNLEAELPVAETERARILAAVPVGLTQEEMVRDLDAIASSLGLSLNAMNFSLQTQGDVQAVSVVANLVGDYEDLIDLIKALETNDRLFQVKTVAVQLNESEGSALQMNFSVRLEGYYQ